MSFPAPPTPSFGHDHVATTSQHLRYEDITQDGRMIPIAMPAQMGGLWEAVLIRHPGARNAMMRGIIPILTRITASTLDQPIRVDRHVEATTGFELARDDGPGEPTRLFLNVWCELAGIAGRMVPPGPDGPRAVAGHLFAEHTFTRPFAPADQRRVTRLDVEGYPAVPSARHPSQDPATAGDAPAGATWRGELTVDPTPIVFTLDQTDSNQHVNSLVYVRVFLDAAQRLLAATGAPLRLRSRAVDIAYRKPCFAGDQVRAHVRLFDSPAGPGAAGFLAAPGDGKSRAYVRVQFGT